MCRHNCAWLRCNPGAEVLAGSREMTLLDAGEPGTRVRGRLDLRGDLRYCVRVGREREIGQSFGLERCTPNFPR
jgi:hypothetical protein